LETRFPSKLSRTWFGASATTVFSDSSVVTWASYGAGSVFPVDILFFLQGYE